MSRQKFSPGALRLAKIAKKDIEARERYVRDVVKRWKFDTVAVHGLYSVEEALRFNQGAVVEPIFMSSSQGYYSADHMEAGLGYLVPNWCYSRIANPSLYYLEATMALIEGYGCDDLTDCCTFSSGMAAIVSAIEPFLTRRECGEKLNFVATCQVYGGTFQQFAERQQKDKGIEWRCIIDSTDPDEWRRNIDGNTRFLYGELPSNPGQAFFDLDAVTALAHEHGIPMIVDSTVATPALLRPLARGADIVVQSVTKSLASSGFGIAGALISRRNIVTNVRVPGMKENFAQWVKFLPGRDNGPNLSPMQAILSLNDIRTLRPRMDRLSRSAQRVAEFLESHPRVASVNYLGLKDNPLHALARKYMVLVDSEHDTGTKENRYGHLLSFCVDGSPKDTRDFFDALDRIWRATDLGRIKSVATIPAISTHSQQGEEGRKMAKIQPTMVRLCVGGEHPDDIIADLDQALRRIGSPKKKRAFPTFAAGGGAALA
ncbi:MAG: O-acetylhomoserine aminocarboxypropyltransferase/cysteine synthase [Deltaproteobacteria bacterium]|nr:O-acetylhomoserine aminocarboxypropyltransferase/cysteine synthase [Deltaproteobacteria bacterium]